MKLERIRKLKLKTVDGRTYLDTSGIDIEVWYGVCVKRSDPEGDRPADQRYFVSIENPDKKIAVGIDKGILEERLRRSADFLRSVVGGDIQIDSLPSSWAYPNVPDFSLSRFPALQTSDVVNLGPVCYVVDKGASKFVGPNIYEADNLLATLRKRYFEIKK